MWPSVSKYVFTALCSIAMVYMVFHFSWKIVASDWSMSKESYQINYLLTFLSVNINSEPIETFQPSIQGV